MAPIFRGVFLASLSVSVIALAACGTTGNANVSNRADASRVDSIMERAAREARANGDTVETVSLLEQIYGRNKDDAAIATSYAQALREDEQFTRARQVVYPFTQGEKAYPDAVMELSMIQLSLGQYKEAELTARKAVELDPQSGRAFLALGTALDAQNYHEQAEVAFRRGIEKWKGDPAPIMNNLALNLASQNKLDQAIDMLEKAKALSPGRQEIERNLRIINTLKEGADDFYTKKAEVKKPEPAPAPAAEKTVTKTTTVEKTETKVEVVKEKPVVKAQPKKPVAKKTTREEIDNKQLPSTNRSGAKQNFNSGN